MEELRKEEEEDEDFDEDEVFTDEEEEYTISQCPCPMCMVIKDIDSYWDNWNPDTPIEWALKNNIDKMDC